MTTYWGNFLNSQDPSSNLVGIQGLPTWHEYSSNSKSTILLPSKEDITVASGIKARECAFLIDVLDASIRKDFA